MPVGDEYRYANGNTYIETESGPLFMWECRECGKPAAASFEYTGTVRCGGCWRRRHPMPMDASSPHQPQPSGRAAGLRF